MTRILQRRIPPKPNPAPTDSAATETAPTNPTLSIPNRPPFLQKMSASFPFRVLNDLAMYVTMNMMLKMCVMLTEEMKRQILPNHT